MKSRLALPILVCALLVQPAGAVKENARVTEADVKAVVQAIEDEIYDYGYQGWGFDVGKHISDDEYRVRVYVEPTLNKDRAAWAIYKLMPFGEVYRLFWIGSDGLAELSGNPEWDFPSTEPSYLTVYMNDDQLCQLKHDWLKSSFVITLKPSPERLREAAERQKKRVGHSVREDPDWRFVPEGQDPRCPPPQAASPPKR